ncbi:MAG TPA: hypothetical protein VFC80_01780 [Sphaerochaeta sp.]|nr:hypothetical protein [Sphaerochaeta sp.]
MSHTKEQELRTTLGASSELWKHFYQLGCLFAHAHDMVSGLTYLIDTFLIRGGEYEEIDSDWIDFFRRQFTVYLLGKQRINCSLCEGDMIHDYLKEEYARIQEELAASELPFAEEHKHRWYASLELDFPWSISISDPQKVC